TLPSPSMMVIKVHGFQYVDNGKAKRNLFHLKPDCGHSFIQSLRKFFSKSSLCVAQPLHSEITQGSEHYKRHRGFKHGWLLVELAQASEGEVKREQLLRVSPCCSAKQPVREAAKLQRGSLPGYPAHAPPHPHLGSCCPSCALRCTHISIMNSK
ncbi:RAS guanyl-releasing protein 1, partial [Dissostichus eleginoides]